MLIQVLTPGVVGRQGRSCLTKIFSALLKERRNNQFYYILMSLGPVDASNSRYKICACTFATKTLARTREQYSKCIFDCRANIVSFCHAKLGCRQRHSTAELEHPACHGFGMRAVSLYVEVLRIGSLVPTWVTATHFVLFVMVFVVLRVVGKRMAGDK